MRNAVIVYLAVVLLLAGGYIANIVRFVGCDFDGPYKAEVIRGIGIVVPPLGGVLGYVGIADGPIDKPQS